MASSAARLERPAQRTLWVAALALAAAVVTAAAALVNAHDAGLLAAARDRVGQSARAAETVINRALLDTDMLLAGLAEPLAYAAATPGGLARTLRQALQQNLQVRDVTLFDEQGRMLADGRDSNPLRGPDLPVGYLAQVLGQPVPMLTVSGPVRSRTTSEWVLFFARAQVLPEGRSVVVAEVPVSVLTDLLTPASDPAGIAVTLERSDGLMLAGTSSVAWSAVRMLAPIPPASAAGQAFDAAGRLDGAAALTAARPTLYPGLLVAVSLPRSEALRAAGAYRQAVYGGAALLGLGLLLVAALGHAHLVQLGRARVQLQASKSMLDQALASISDGFLVYDREDRVVAWNRRYVELFPWLEPLLTEGVPFRRLAEAGAVAVIPEGSAAEREAWIAQRIAIRSGGGGSFAQVVADGRVVDTVERRMPDGGLVCIYRDITESERVLRQAKAQAEQANEAKSRFLATVSHEMRTPLNGVLGMLGLLMAGSLTPRQRRQAELARSSGQALLTVLNDVLDLSKIEAGRMTLELIPFEPAVTVREVVSLLEVRAQARGLPLGLHVGREPPPLLGDPSRLRQVLFNLVGNALKFTERGRVDVTLSHRLLDSGQVELTLEVADTGIGIDPDTLPHLFERFSQADSSTARRFGGTGLGLAITREIVDLMHGRIDVDTAPGRGSRFSVVVTLPQAVLAAPEPMEAAGGRPPAPQRRLRLLAAEDNGVNQIIIKALLEEEGHFCDVVADGVEAVRQVQAAHYDLVLMDIEMPEMDGLAATRAIRALAGPVAQMPIVAMTAHVLPTEQARYRYAGMDGLVSKPVNATALRRAIVKAMERARQGA